MQGRNNGEHTVLLLFLLAGILIFTVIISMTAGRFSVSAEEFWQLLHGEGRDPDSPLHAARTVLFESRIPRIAAAAVIGASLSCSGAAYQGIFHNPVVSPDILGAGTGAAFGAVLAIYMGTGTLLMQISAFLFGLLAVAAAYLVGSAIAGRTGISTITLVLTGMVTGSLFSAFISIIKFIGDPYDTLPAITFWLMGGLTYVTSHDVLMMLIPFAGGMIPLLLFRWRLNVLSLDEEEAKAMGVNTVLLRILFIFCATLISSSSVAVGGMIGWVGLIVPHIARMLTGPDYAKLIPCSMLVGAVFLMIVDDLSRCISVAELPLGVLTSVVGAPFFLWLMYKGRRSFL